LEQACSEDHSADDSAVVCSIPAVLLRRAVDRWGVAPTLAVPTLAATMLAVLQWRMDPWAMVTWLVVLAVAGRWMMDCSAMGRSVAFFPETATPLMATAGPVDAWAAPVAVEWAAVELAAVDSAAVDSAAARVVLQVFEAMGLFSRELFSAIFLGL
jgi:hypothetical protein